MHRTPGHYRDYPSSMCSKYYCWFKDYGYPELDIIEHNDGAWSIRQFHQTPVIPCLTKWSFVLQDIRNTLLTPSFLMNQIEQLDLEKRAIWDQQCKSEEKARLDTEREERRAQDWTDQMLKGITRNPDLMERIAKNGFKELDPNRMLNHFDKRRLGNKGKHIKYR